MALNLIDRCLDRNYHPQIILMDGGYGNNSNLLKEIEQRGLKYIGVIVAR
ncbi:MAG: transposase [Cyanobacterium sp.]